MAINQVTFNSVNFWKELGAALSAPISYPVPTEVKELVKIKGANGSLTEATGYYNNIEIDAKFKVLIGRGNPEYNTFEKVKKKINLLFSNIMQSKLSFSDIPGKYYKVKTAGIGPVTKISDYEATFEVTFNCDPFLYLQNEKPIESASGTVTVDYEGDIPNAPVIEITVGTPGNIHLTINKGSLLNFEGASNTTYFINKSPYSIVTDSQGKGIKSSGPTPILSKGQSTISATKGIGSSSTITKIKVTKNERYLG